MTARNNHTGRIERDIDQARLDTEAAELRAKRWGYQQIADHQGCSVSTAYERVKRAIESTPYEAVEELRRVELESLDELERAAMAVLRTRHVKVDHGRLIVIDGEPLIDDAPVLHAIQSILRIKERRARLTGIDTPVRVEQRHTVEHKSELDAEIERLLAGMGPVEQGQAPVEAASEAEPAHP